MAVSSANAKRLGTKALTTELKKLGSEVVDIDKGGEPITREQQLAAMIWRQAIGWWEETRDDNGNKKKVWHPPVAWCQQFLFERMEGKAPQATQDETSGIKAVDKVRELSVSRINAIGAKKQETANGA